FMQLLRSRDAPSGMSSDVEVVILWLVSLGAIRPDVVEECDGRAFPRIEEKVQEIRMTGRAPPAPADSVNQRKSKHGAIELHGLPQLPSWPRGVVDAVEPQLGGVRIGPPEFPDVHVLSEIVAFGRIGAVQSALLVDSILQCHAGILSSCKF